MAPIHRAVGYHEAREERRHRPRVPRAQPPMTVTLSGTNSAMIALARSILPSADRHSTSTFCPAHRFVATLPPAAERRLPVRRPEATQRLPRPTVDAGASTASASGGGPRHHGGLRQSSPSSRVLVRPARPVSGPANPAKPASRPPSAAAPGSALTPAGQRQSRLSLPGNPDRPTLQRTAP
jgi:hypothetical protein